jgi:hypothetical protein
LTGNSLGQPPSGISGTGPLLGPPALNRSLGRCGVGDADALLGGDRLLLRGAVGLFLSGGVFLGRGEGMVFSDGLLVGGGVVMVVEGGLLPPTSTGVSSLAGSSYGYTSQATPEVPSEAVPIGPSNPLGSEGSRLSSACASACELKLAQSNSSCARAGLLGLICWKVRAATTPATSTNVTTAANFNGVGTILKNIVRDSARSGYTEATLDASVLDDALA